MNTYIIVGIILFSAFNYQYKGNRNYFKNEFLYDKISRVEPRLIQFDDTIPNDTVYICFTANQFPYAYFREIVTNVYSDNNYFPVQLLLYWSPGGDFIGYSIKDNGILTRKGHIPFDEQDYIRLHHLLDDPKSLLENYKLSDLVSYEQTTLKIDGENNAASTNIENTVKVDAISRATTTDVKDYVVEGAALITYILWHTVYGPTYDSIKNISLEYMSPSFLENLLYSPYIEDNYYALFNLNHGEFDVTKAFIPKLEAFITTDDFLLRENSIDALVSSGLPDSLIQESLMNVFKRSDYETKHRILRILNTCSYLSANTIEKLTDYLPEESVPIIQKVINLLQSRVEPDITIKLKIADLLENNNRFIAKMAYDYLSSLDHHEKILSEKIRKYETMLDQHK